MNTNIDHDACDDCDATEVRLIEHEDGARRCWECHLAAEDAIPAPAPAPALDKVDQVVALAITEGKTMELIEAGDTELRRRLEVTGWAPAEARAFIRDFSHRLHVACFGPGYNS